MRRMPFRGCLERKRRGSNWLVGVLLFLLLFSIWGCGASRKVTRIEPEAVVDLSGRWNDTDSRLVAEEMIRDALARPWLEEFIIQKGKKPDVIVGRIRNESYEHISVETFIQDLERELTNSGKVNFVAGKSEREQIREERLDQTRHASEESAKRPGQEAGADFMLIGSINSILDESKGKKVIYYQVDLRLVDMETNRKAWLGQKKIKKLLTRKRVTF